MWKGRGALIKSQKGKKACVEGKVGECVQWKAHGQCSCSLSHDTIASGNSGAHSARERKALQTKGATKIVKTRHVNFGILPCVKTSCLRPDANTEEHVSADMLRLRRRPARSQRKELHRISCNIEGVDTIGLCVSRFLSEKICSTEGVKIGIKSHRQILQGHLAPK